MSTSGVADWNPDLLGIIRDAHLNIGSIAEDENPTAEDYQSGLRKLNGMVKTIEATGSHVWAEEEAILFLQPRVKRYVIGGSAPTAETSDEADWLELTLAAPAALGATHVTLQTGQGALVAVGMRLGVVDNSGLTEWFTVPTPPVGNVVALGGALLVGADAGNYALAYTTKISRPLKIPAARLLTLNGLNETPMTILSRQGYMDLPNKDAQGPPTQWFYSPRRDDGLLYPWPVPQFSSWAMRFTWYRPLQDFLVPTNTADFPQEWVLPLQWNLSKELAPGFGVPAPTWDRIKEMADTYAMVVVSYDRESEPVQFGIDNSTGAG
jgi:hypothetical protein